MSFSEFFNYPTGSQSDSSGIDFNFWSDRPSADWDKLLRFTQSLRFHSGEIAVNRGQVDSGFYIVSFGRLREDDQNGPIGHLNEGEPFGLAPFFDGQTHSSSLTASMDSQLLHITRTAIDTLAAHDPKLARELLFECGRLLALKTRF